MPILIIVILGIGILFGAFLPTNIVDILTKNIYVGNIGFGFVEFSLCLLMLSIGFEIANMEDFKGKIKRLGKRFFFFPVFNVIFSLVGGAIGALVVGVRPIEGISLSAGLGWYSFTSAFLSQYSAPLGAMALVVNVLREVLSMLLVPFIYKKVGKYGCIAMSGSPCMDTNLPVLTNVFKDEDVGIIAIINGVILSFMGAALVVLFSSFI